MSTIIIGGGLGGLVCGAALSRSGESVTLFEQHSVVGGYATTYKRKGHLIEGGLHQMDGLDEWDLKTDILGELGALDGVEWIKTPEFNQVIHGDSSFIIPSGRAAVEEAFCSKFPAEAPAIRRFLGDLYAIRRELQSFYPTLYPSPSLATRLRMLSYPFRFPKIVTYLSKTLGNVLDRSFKSEELKLLFASCLGYYHDNPHELAMVYYGIGTGSYLEGGGHFVKGGSQRLSDYLRGVIEQHGGTVRTNRRVSGIERRGDRVVAVHVSDKDGETTRHEADRVVANTSPINALAMLGDAQEISDAEKATQPAPRERDRVPSSVPPGPSLLSLWYVFNRPLPELGSSSYSTFVLDPEVRRLSQFKLYPDTAPTYFMLCDYAHIDSGLGEPAVAVATIDHASRWKTLNSTEYAAMKQTELDAYLEKIDRLYPGAKAELTYAEAATPLTMQRYTENPEGAVYGSVQTPPFAGPKRERAWPEIPGLYYASAWGFPGGGFTGGILSGYLAARRILQRR
ncbi:MAG: phytoene desaturase family protein [Spirochaetales bacterium]